MSKHGSRNDHQRATQTSSLAIGAQLEHAPIHRPLDWGCNQCPNSQQHTKRSPSTKLIEPDQLATRANNKSNLKHQDGGMGFTNEDKDFGIHLVVGSAIGEGVGALARRKEIFSGFGRFLIYSEPNFPAPKKLYQSPN